jgi:hypothetical protein
MIKIEGSGSASGSGSISKRHGSADPDSDPDPHQNVMDPQHWSLIIIVRYLALIALVVGFRHRAGPRPGPTTRPQDTLQNRNGLQNSCFLLRGLPRPLILGL